MGGGEPRIPHPFTREERLLEAVRRGDRAAIARALELGASLAAKDDLGRSPVLRAVLADADLDFVRWLHARGAVLDAPDVGGRTALSFAAERGRLDVVRYLVDNGAEVNRRDMQQRTPLFHAALGDHAEVVAFLLALAGYDPEAIPEHHRKLALHTAWCFRGGLYDVESIAEAIDASRSRARKLVEDLRFAAKPGV